MKATTVVPFPPGAPELKVRRRSESDTSTGPVDPANIAASAAALAAERRRLEEDAEALRIREANLREYESRLRAIQGEMDSACIGVTRSAAPFPGRSANPFPQDPNLDAAWQKVHRARELTEAEQAHLRDDRIAMHAFEVELKQREAAVTLREARAAEQEKNILAATRPQRTQAPGPQTVSTFTRLTRTPFRMAESMLRGKGKDANAEE